MALATLSIDVVAKLATLEEGMTKASRIVEKNAAQMTRSFDAMKTAGVAIGGVLAGAFAGFSVASFLRGTANGLDALNDLKDATGASIENISALEDIGARTGTRFDSLADILVKFNKVLADAKDPASEGAKALESIGLSADELRKMDPAEALRQTAVALDTFADDGNKARFVWDAFGKSIQVVAPFLHDLAGQGKLVGTVTTEQAAAAEKFNQQLASLAKNSQDSARALTGWLLPSLNNVFDAYNRFGALNGIVLPIIGQDAVSQSQARAAALVAESKRVGDAIARMSEEFSRDPGNDLLKGRIDKARDKLAGLTKQADLASQQLRQLANGLSGTPVDLSGLDRVTAGSFNLKSSIPDAPDKIIKVSKDVTSEVERYIDRLQQAQIAALDLSNEEKVRFDLLSGKLGPVTEEQSRLLIEYAKGLDKLAEPRPFVGPVFDPDLLKQRIDDEKTLNALLDATPSAMLEETRRKMQLLADAFSAGKINVTQLGEAQQTALGQLPENAKEALDQMSVFAEQASRNIQDALGTSIKSVLKGDFKSIGDLWLDLLANMASQALAARIGEALFPKVGGAGGVGADLFKTVASFFGFAQGGVFANGVVPFANGGIFSSPHLFRFANGGALSAGVLGEAGPEAVMPLRRGSDGKLGVVAHGGGAGTAAPVVNIYNTIGAGVTRGEVLGVVQTYGNQLKGDILASMRGGGAFSR